MRLLIIVFLFFVSIQSLASVKTLEVVVGLAKPPYVIEGGATGFEIELVREIFKRAGYKVNFVLVPFGRTTTMLNRDDVDAIVTVNEATIADESVLSESYIYYQNVAISRIEENLTLNTISDLGKYSVSAFQNAHKILGGEFAKAMEVSPLYLQSARQEVQSDLLVKGKVKFVVMDVNIFKHYAKTKYSPEESTQFKFHFVFPKSFYHVAIKNDATRKAFNRELAEVKASSFYADLLTRYQLNQ